MTSLLSTPRMKLASKLVIVLAAFALVAAACGDDDEPTTAAPTTAAPTTAAPTTAAPTTAAPTTAAPTTAAPEPATVTFSLDFFTFNGYHSPAHVAIEKGWFADENLTVEVVEGAGSQATATLVGEGQATFGMVVGTTIISAVAAGVPIISTAQHLTFSGFCAIATQDSGINTPEDMRGRTLANPPFGASGPLVPAFLDGYGMTEEDINIVSIGETTALVALREGLTDTWISTLFGFPIQFKEEFGEDVKCFPFSAVDADPVGWGIVVNTDYLAENPDTVKRFLRAFLKGWKYTLDNPLEATKITAAAVPTTTSAETGAASLQFILDFDLAPFATADLPFAGHDQGNWENSLELAQKFLGLETVPTLDQLYTNDYLPTAEEIEAG